MTQYKRTHHGSSSGPVPDDMRFIKNNSIPINSVEAKLDTKSRGHIKEDSETNT